MQNAVRLSNAPSGSEVLLKKIHADRDVCLQLAAMGLLESVKVAILRNNGKDPLLIKFRGVQLMMGRHLSDSIEVRIEKLNGE